MAQLAYRMASPASTWASILQGNRAHRGGAVWVGLKGSFFSESGLSIVNNSASGTGGGIYNMGRVQIIGAGAIERNTASGRRGGIHSRGGAIDLENGGLRIANNSAAGGGGFSLVEGAQLTAFYGLYVGNNRSTNAGGGGIGADASTVRLAHATIEGNRATKGAGVFGKNANITIDKTTFRDNRLNSNAPCTDCDVTAENSTVTIDGVLQ